MCALLVRDKNGEQARDKITLIPLIFYITIEHFSNPVKVEPNHRKIPLSHIMGFKIPESFKMQFFKRSPQQISCLSIHNLVKVLKLLIRDSSAKDLVTHVTTPLVLSSFF